MLFRNKILNHVDVIFNQKIQTETWTRFIFIFQKQIYPLHIQMSNVALMVYFFRSLNTAYFKMSPKIRYYE